MKNANAQDTRDAEGKRFLKLRLYDFLGIFNEAFTANFGRTYTCLTNSIGGTGCRGTEAAAGGLNETRISSGERNLFSKWLRSNFTLNTTSTAMAKPELVHVGLHMI